MPTKAYLLVKPAPRFDLHLRQPLLHTLKPTPRRKRSAWAGKENT